MDEARARFLRDRVMTATPAQRVVMLYDRLTLDLARAGEATERIERSGHLGHATQIVAELHASLDQSVGGPAENLATLYTFMITELVAMRATGVTGIRLERVAGIVSKLRSSWVQVAEQTAGTLPAGAWVS